MLDKETLAEIVAYVLSEKERTMLMQKQRGFTDLPEHVSEISVQKPQKGRLLGFPDDSMLDALIIE